MSSFHLRMMPIPRHARILRSRLLQYGSSWNMGSRELEEFVTAVSEAFANAVEHAGSPDPIEIDVRVDRGDKVVATITDNGCGFDASSFGLKLPPATAERGRGIPLMRRYSDLFSIRSTRRGGTTVTLVRRLSAPHRKMRDISRQMAG